MKISLFTCQLADRDEFVRAANFYKALQDKFNSFQSCSESFGLSLRLSIDSVKDHNIQGTRYNIIVEGPESEVAMLKLLI